MPNLFERYLMAYEKASSPKSREFSTRAIYAFSKYCKRCKAGMKKPKGNARRVIRWLFGIGYCSNECEKAGPNQRVFERTIKATASGGDENAALETLLDISGELRREEEGLKPMERIIRQVGAFYTLLSEKLSAMELLTNEKWDRGKWYFWLRKIK